MSTVNMVRQLKKRELTGSKININPHWVKDKCIMCHQDTRYTIATCIYVRQHYVEGMGQMCPSCFYATNNVSTTWDHDDFLDYLY